MAPRRPGSQKLLSFSFWWQVLWQVGKGSIDLTKGSFFTFDDWWSLHTPHDTSVFNRSAWPKQNRSLVEAGIHKAMKITKRVVLLVASVVCQAVLVLAGKGNYILSCYKTWRNVRFLMLANAVFRFLKGNDCISLWTVSVRYFMAISKTKNAVSTSTFTYN